MNQNINLECEVCKNVVRLKVQGGYIKINPFVYSCPECKVTISGHLIWNEDLKQGFIQEFKSNNANWCDITDDESPTHVLQLGTEFFTDKIKEFQLEDPSTFFSPFMLDPASHEIKQKKSVFSSLLTEQFDSNVVIVMRLWELYKNENYKYLNRQLLLYGFVKPVLMGEMLKIDYKEVMNNVVYYPFKPFLSYNERMNDLKKLKVLLEQTKNQNRDEIINLKKDLNELINYADENIISLLKNFAEYYHYLLPVILSNVFSENNIQNVKEQKGILTTNFDNIKNYYIEAFETLCSLLPVFLGIQNIIKRSDRNAFEPNMQAQFTNITDIGDYHQKVKNKGNKVKYFTEENLFIDVFDIENVLDNSIRNSIGHHSYIYEPDNQLINFKNGNNTWKLYLIEFADLLYETFNATFAAFEVITFMKNIDH
ncbi:hypothetical protein [Salibacterium lacus]|uniref:Uncharacterized protein n=1 Tax=Salibacterium lacus TaxID=1898109 RepID=A0ABW5T4P8_9BACI